MMVLAKLHWLGEGEVGGLYKNLVINILLLYSYQYNYMFMTHLPNLNHKV